MVISVQVDPSLRDTTIVEWYKDKDRIEFYHPVASSLNCEYCENSEENLEDPKFILHPNNSITIENMQKVDVGAYTCLVQTGVGEPIGTKPTHFLSN